MKTAAKRTTMWTAEYLSFVLPLTPDRVLVSAGPNPLSTTPASREEWRWIQTAQRLVWTHGFKGALQRLQAYGHTAAQTRAAA